MSSSGEQALQRRDPRYHVPYGQIDNGDYRRSLRAKPEDFHVPHSDEFPPEPATEYNHRPEVHLPQDYRPTLFTPRHARSSKGNRTTADTVLTTRTKTVGKEKRRGWKTTQLTDKVLAKRAKAARWSPPPA